MARLKTDDPIVRANILAAAEELIAERGLAAASIRDIAATAGVTSAMVHYYFGSKDGLYRAMLENAVESVRSFIAAVSATPAPAPAKLAQFIEGEVHYILSHPKLARILLREMLAGGKELIKIFQQYPVNNYLMLRQLIGDGVKRKELRPVDIDLAPLSLMGMMMIFHAFRPVIAMALGKPEYDEAFIKRVATHTANLYLNGVAATETLPEKLNHRRAKPISQTASSAKRKPTPNSKKQVKR
ncbi:MAG: CerR family C-terminal domain-containing protein [Acidobacteriota bacterium]